MSRLPDHIGIDFGNHTIKALQLGNVDSTPELIGIASQPTPVGVINSEDKSHQRQLADILKNLVDEGSFRTRNVIAALPEYSIFTRFVELPGVSEDELEDAVHWQAKQVVPIPMNDVQMSWIVLGKDQAKNITKVLLVAAPRKLIDLYVQVLTMAKLEPVAVETEAIASGRAVYKAGGIGDAVILDFGSQSTDMGIMSGGNMLFSQSISIGSDSLTRAISTEFSFEYNQAEEYKRNYGLDPSQVDGKIYKVLKPIVDSIISEVRRGLEFYKGRTNLIVPKQYMLIGDGALLNGLVVYLAQELGAGVQMADPWVGIKYSQSQSAIIADSGAAYAVAIGLALKSQ